MMRMITIHSSVFEWRLASSDASMSNNSLMISSRLFSTSTLVDNDIMIRRIISPNINYE